MKSGAIDKPLLKQFENTVKQLCMKASSAFTGDSVESRIIRDHLFRPLDYHSCADFVMSARFLEAERHSKILDISSPQWFSLCMASWFPETEFVYCTILEEDIHPFRAIARACSLDNIEYDKQDVRNLSYSDQLFDGAVSISVIEHIDPERGGDDAALGEIKRVLRNTGLLVVVLPYKDAYNVVYVDGPIYERKENKTNFFAREYDRSSLQALLKRSGFTPSETAYISEKAGPLALDYLHYGPGRGTRRSHYTTRTLRRVEKTLGHSLESWIAQRYLSISQSEHDRLVNVALRLMPGTNAA